MLGFDIQTPLGEFYMRMSLHSGGGQVSLLLNLGMAKGEGAKAHCSCVAGYFF